MPSVEAIKAAYARSLSLFDTVTIDHAGETGTARARVFAETSDPLSDTIQQSALKAIIYADDLAFVPERGDLLIVRDHTYAIQAVDDATRSVGGVVIAYQVTL